MPVAVVVFERIDAVIHRFEVLDQEDAVGECPADGQRLGLEYGRVPFGYRIRFRVVKQKEYVAHRIARVGIHRIARHHQRIYFGTGRKDITQSRVGVAFVVVGHTAAEIERVGLVRQQGILDVDLDAASPERDERCLFHERRGVKLLLLILELYVFVEFDIDPLLFEIDSAVCRCHRDDNRRQ